MNLHGSGDENIEDNELGVGDVHLHYMTAKKEISDGAVSLKGFWDELYSHIIDFGGRILAGDFNMALWQVIPEVAILHEVLLPWI